ncbi:MAG: hypothetical protein GXY83_06105 [Rhodopirellula sp.]|nr:hypothetical protein [Rhodopirellula sp.]
MRWPFMCAIALLLGSQLQPEALPAEQSRVFRVGLSQVDITPEKLPVSMLGSFSDRPATSVHDPLYVRTLVLDDGTLRVAIAVCDICAVPRELFDEAKRRAAQSTGIPPQQMLMAATHTHTAPAVVDLLDAVPVDAEYTRLLVAKMAEGVEKAAGRLAPAEIGWGLGSLPEEVGNRRWLKKEGTIPPNPFGETGDRAQMNPSAGSPDLVHPAGPTDPDVSLLSVVEPGGRARALLANYSLHYVGGIPAGMLSADYFGEFCGQIRQRLAPDAGPDEFLGILSNGTSGDINNIDFLKPRPRAEPFQRIREVAGRVADVAAQAQRQVKHQAWVPLSMVEREIEVGVRKPNAEQLQQAQALLADLKEKAHGPVPEYYARSSLRLSQWPDTVKIKLQALRIGDLAITAMPCEVFAEIGLEIKRRSPLRPVFVIQLANGYNGYLPTPQQHALGGYETWRAPSSYLEVTASRKMTETLLEMLAELAR